METKTYCAATMAEALAEVKRDLGRDAVILHTRSFRKGGLLGLGGRSMWEVTASAQVNVPQRLPGGEYLSVSGQAEGGAPAAVMAPAGVGESLGESLCRQVVELRSMVAKLMAQAPPRPSAAVSVAAGPYEDAATLPGELAAWRRHLLRQEVAEEVVATLLARAAEELTPAERVRGPVVREKLVSLIAANIPIAEVAIPAATSRPRVIALIGPTGVGKTTTIAKLAARYKLSDRRRVGLITIDTYRIAAVDQLKTYAQILEVPLRTVLRPEELTEALAAMEGLDVVLIDTAGRSPADGPRLRQMRAFLEAAGPDEVQLVVSATAGRACAARVLDSFDQLGANRWMLSKLDEAGTYGVALNVARTIKTPITFVTTGQEVPDDLAPANPRRLAELIVGEGVPYGG